MPRIILCNITEPFIILLSSHLFVFQLPSFVFSEEYQNELVENTAKAFNNQTLGVIGEMIWNFADFMTKQVRSQSRVTSCKWLFYLHLYTYYCSVCEQLFSLR